MIDFPRVRSDKGSLSPGPQPSSYALPKLFKLLCKEPGREEGNPNPGCLEFCQERITRQQVGPRSLGARVRGRRARAPAPAPAARRLHRPTWPAPPLFCAPAAECNKSSEISRILARGRCLCSARTAQPTDRANEPALLRAIPANGIYCPADRSLARLASNEAVSVTASVRASVGTHSGFRSSSSSLQHVPYTNTNAAVKRSPPQGGRPGTARKPHPPSARLRPPFPTAATSVIARGPPRWLPPCPRRLSAETPRTP